MTLLEEIEALMESGEPFSDIHIEEGLQATLRTPRGWVTLGDDLTTSIDSIEDLLIEIDADWSESIKHGALKKTLTVGCHRLRFHAYLSNAGTKKGIIIRRLPLQPMPFSETGLPNGVLVMASAPRGLILVVGATSSGKTTSIAAIVDAINKDSGGHIVTVEDPIEYQHSRINAIFTQREVGLDVRSYLEGVHDAMRQSPDVIVVGEIRDGCTADACFQAAESGHLVIASLHANSAIGAIHKLLGFFPDNQRKSREEALAHALVGVIHQVLLPNIKRDGHALASGLLFNEKGKLGDVIMDTNKLRTFMETQSGNSITRSLTASMTELIRSGKVDKAEVLRVTAYSHPSFSAELTSMGL